MPKTKVTVTMETRRKVIIRKIAGQPPTAESLQAPDVIPTPRPTHGLLETRLEKESKPNE